MVLTHRSSAGGLDIGALSTAPSAVGTVQLTSVNLASDQTIALKVQPSVSDANLDVRLLSATMVRKVRA